MPSLLPGYEYDIFISYRQKDNKGAKWVTTFVEALRAELEATFKEDLSIYFDENPHDGLLETHHVDKSLEGKLKCLIFIPIVSQTYCDTKSFAWTQEFCAFNKLAAEDSFGRDIRLSNGNVASRILPVRIHGLDARDQKSLETEIGSVLRSVEFIYREPGVNRPLSPDDDPSDNLNKTRYRNQVNKVANTIKDIIAGIQNFGKTDFAEPVIEKPTDAVRSQDKSIVVLPFEDMSEGKDQAYFCDGLAEELINALTKIKDLHVVARTSAFSFKGKEHDAQKIGEKLNVGTLLEGSVRKAGNRLRITVQLINVSDGFHLWSERFDREVADVFAIQDEIAMNVVEKLNVALAGGEKNMVMKHHTNNIEAHSSYLKGRYHGMMFTEDDRTKALENYTAAIEKDPQYALAYSGLADLHCMMGLFSTNHPEEMYLKAKGHAEKAIALDPRLGEAYQASASVKMFFERKWLDAGKDYQRAIELSPGSAIVHINYAIHLMAIGKSEEAIAAGMRAISLDPLSSTVNQLFGFIYFALAQFDQAISQLRKALELNPGNAWAQVELGWSYGYKGMSAEARMEIEKAEEIKKEFDPWFCTTIACVFAMQGKKGMVEKALSQVKDFSRNNYVDPTDFAVLYAWLGDADEAFRWLEKGIKERAIHMYFVRNMSYLWLKPIASDPRYKNILDRIGLGGFVQSKTIDPIPPIAPAKSIIVLPFENMSPDKDNEYFSDGLTEEIIADLSKVTALSVISRGSAMSFKGSKKKTKDVAAEVNVRYVLEGSVRKEENNLRITAQLIDGTTDAHLWAEKYSGTVDHVFEFQEKLSRSIVAALKVYISPDENEKLAEHPITHIQAYECYIRARQDLWKLTEKGLSGAIAQLEHGLELGGPNATIHATLATVYMHFHHFGLKVTEEMLTMAGKHLALGLDLDPGCAQAHYVKGILLFKRGNIQQATHALKKVLTIDPGNTDALLLLSVSYCISGKADHARPHAARLLQLDPLTVISQAVQGWIEYYTGNLKAAMPLYERWLKLDPESPFTRWCCFAAFSYVDLDRAYEVADSIVKDMPQLVFAKFILFYKAALLGDKTAAMRYATSELKEQAANIDYLRIQMGMGFALIDENEQAVWWLRKSFEGGYTNYPLLLGDPFLKNLRGYDDFDRLMNEIKDKWEKFEV